MQEAMLVRDTLSTESKHPTGAVAVKDGKVIARAANQSRLRNHKLLALHRRYCIRKMLHVPTGKRYWMCPGCASHHQHAESGLVSSARQVGVDLTGANVCLYGHWWCCKPCWDAMISVGIKDVYLLQGSEHLFNPQHMGNILGNR